MAKRETAGTELRRAEHGGEWCNTAAMRALGYAPEQDIVRDPCQVVRELRNAGLEVEELPGSYFQDVTLGQFYGQHPDGRFLLFSSRHCMALVDGLLTDTANGGARRKLFARYRVS